MIFFMAHIAAAACEQPRCGPTLQESETPHRDFRSIVGDSIATSPVSGVVVLKTMSGVRRCQPPEDPEIRVASCASSLKAEDHILAPR
jgi:hypothetical protein